MVRPYRGEALTLRDGQRVESGRPILVIHFASVRVRRLLKSTDRPFTWVFSRTLRKEFQALAAAALKGEVPWFDAVYGASWIGPSVRRFGFECRPAPRTFANVCLKHWVHFLRSTFHPTRRFRRDANRSELSIAWMSRAAFLRRFGPDAAPR